MKTIKAFVQQTNIPERLVRAVIRAVGGFESFTAMAPDVCNHGADGGFSGFIYYADTVKFTRKNKKDILKLAADMAADIMVNGDEYQLIADFNALKSHGFTVGDVARALHGRAPYGDDDAGYNMRQIYNVLAWFALEEVARAYCDQLETQA